MKKNKKSEKELYVIKQSNYREMFFSLKILVSVALIAAILSVFYELMVAKQLFAGLLYIPLKSIIDLFFKNIDNKEFKVVYELYMGLAFFIPIYFIFRRKIFKLVNGDYLPCPYCNKSVKVYEKWQCPHCDNWQNSERYIIDKCDHCHRHMKSVFCEHCHKEFRI